MPDRRMGLFDRAIGGVVDGLMIAIDTITSFWQTPREVEWAKAAADGLAEREAEEEVAEPHGLHEVMALLITETSAPTPGAVDGPAVGEPPEPSAVVGAVCIVCFRPSGNCDCVDRLLGPGPDLSAAVESPASVPAAESPAPEFDWVTAAIPVIAGVLAGHVPEQQHFGPVLCHDSLVRIHAEFVYWQEWLDHVAPLIAAALQTPRTATVYNFASGDRPRPLADFPKHQK